MKILVEKSFINNFLQFCVTAAGNLMKFAIRRFYLLQRIFSYFLFTFSQCFFYSLISSYSPKPLCIVIYYENVES